MAQAPTWKTSRPTAPGSTSATSATTTVVASIVVHRAPEPTEATSGSGRPRRSTLRVSGRRLRLRDPDGGSGRRELVLVTKDTRRELRGLHNSARPRHAALVCDPRIGRAGACHCGDIIARGSRGWSSYVPRGFHLDQDRPASHWDNAPPPAVFARAEAQGEATALDPQATGMSR